MSPLRAVFLDIGDTIVRANPSWEGVYKLALDEYGISIPLDGLRDALRRAYHHGGYGFDGSFEPTPETSFRRTMELDQRALAELGVTDLPEDFYRRLSEVFLLVNSWHVFPDAVPALEELRRRGLILGAVSNWVWQLPELLHSLELVSHFDFVAVSSRVGYEKPHAGIFEHARAQAGVPAASVIHVGDHLDADVRGARAVGIDGILIDREGRQPELPGVPCITSLEELLPIIDARNGRSA
jgi:putative hydrolase of the HAD superfamily